MKIYGRFILLANNEKEVVEKLQHICSLAQTQASEIKVEKYDKTYKELPRNYSCEFFLEKEIDTHNEAKEIFLKFSKSQPFHQEEAPSTMPIEGEELKEGEAWRTTEHIFDARKHPVIHDDLLWGLLICEDNSHF